LSNLTSRTLVALVAIPAIFFITYQGDWVFFLFVVVLTVLGMLEYYKLAEAKGTHPQKVLGVILGIILLVMFFKELFLFTKLPFFIFSFSFFIFIVELFRNKENPIQNLATTFFGIIYIAGSFGTLLALREMQNAELVIAIFISIWICDSAAYFGGRAFGKHKLFLRVSPKKTWEGAIAGFLGAIMSVFALYNTILHNYSLNELIMLSVFVGVFGQLGDLFESLLKRDANIKDSSTIIPGHGGVLDRFDSLLFVAPMVYMYFKFVIGN